MASTQAVRARISWQDVVFPGIPRTQQRTVTAAAFDGQLIALTSIPGPQLTSAVLTAVGLMKPASGKVAIAGSSHDSVLAYVPPVTTFDGALTVRESVTIGARPTNDQSTADFVDWILRSTGLVTHASTPIREASHVVVVYTAFAQAFAANRPIIAGDVSTLFGIVNPWPFLRMLANLQRLIVVGTPEVRPPADTILTPLEVEA